MNPAALVYLLLLRRLLERRERWTQQDLQNHQAASLRTLRAFAHARSPFYQRFHRGLEGRPLQELPVLTKGLLMEHFDTLVTDPALRLSNVQSFLAEGIQDTPLLGRYRVMATSGSTGHPGVFLCAFREWMTVLASYARAGSWAGARAGPLQRMKLAVIGSTTSWHQSAQIAAALDSPWVPTLRLAATEPLGKIVEQLNDWQPNTLAAYAAMAHLLAEEQLGGRLRMAPQVILVSAEVFSEEARRSVSAAWKQPAFNVYGTTEGGSLAAECGRHQGLHLFEDLVIAEAVDEANRPIPPGMFAAKVLLTVLFGRTQPLIRYEISDSLRLAPAPCPCGRPFALIDRIQGRREEVLHFPSRRGNPRPVHPNLFHEVLETVPASGWQVIQESDRLEVLVSGLPEGYRVDSLKSNLVQALGNQGIIVPPVHIRPVPFIPRTPGGKAPLVRSNLS